VHVSQSCAPPSSPLFPYPTLFRSSRQPGPDSARLAEEVSRGASDVVQWSLRPVKWNEPSFSAGTREAEKKNSLTISVSRPTISRSEEHTSELQSLRHLVCRLLLEK